MRRKTASTAKKGPTDDGQEPPNKGKKYPAEILKPDEVKRLINAASRTAISGIRNRALIGLLYRAGLRIGEALALHPKDIDRKVGTIRVLHGKGDKPRTVGVDTTAMALLDRWMDKRAALRIRARTPVFCTLEGTPMSTAYVRMLLPRLAKKAGIQKRVHAHGLRHTMAAELRSEGTDIGIISKQLGHASISTTARYLDHIAPQQVIDAMRKREWSL